MKTFPENSIDTIITDPPYGLSFMGKKWDYDVPSIKVWKECLRVIKHGGTLLCFTGARTQHRTACVIEDAGWILKDCIMWLYGSGFPKATDISKQLDKKMGTFVEGKETANSRSGVEGDYKNFNHSKKITEANPQSEEAKLWNGWKSHGLKPAYEPILVAMKPNEGSYAQNALKHGVAGLNIDGGRIEGEKGDGVWGTSNKTIRTDRKFNASPKMKEYKSKENPQGRFPANIILDEEAARMLDEQSGESKSGKIKDSKGSYDGHSNTGFLRGISNKGNQHSDTGGASRFFYTAKASKQERNAGCEELEKGHKRRDDGQPHGMNTNKTRPDGSERKEVPPQTNHHPTVKPLALMEYLCTLTKTPTGGVVLDPFAGSGSTLIAAVKTGRDFIGIEKEKEYCRIVEARLKAVRVQKTFF